VPEGELVRVDDRSLIRRAPERIVWVTRRQRRSVSGPKSVVRATLLREGGAYSAACAAAKRGGSTQGLRRYESRILHASRRLIPILVFVVVFGEVRCEQRRQRIQGRLRIRAIGLEH
jgi:hypothetical protein